MSTEQATIDFLLEQLHPLDVHARKMFGEYALYCDTKVIALVCDDRLYLKPSSADVTFKAECEENPPYPGAKLYLEVPEDLWHDRSWLQNAVSQTAAALPLPKPKKKR